ncbi:hypothetical protein HPB47_009178 [Ixodes persulcatus]|uniref:Uncharacterized protein n=1 Tax=Ixodes persulcatus TaxID=34615 RepID=A0AC60P2Y2_IXOPE|nr:hypothetical protein HPB47_009178 [Ixodes persulcatus]
MNKHMGLTLAKLELCSQAIQTLATALTPDWLVRGDRRRRRQHKQRIQYIPDLNPELMTTISKLLGERIELEKARTVESSEKIKDELDANLEQLKNALKGREDDLVVILAIIEDLKKAGNQSVGDADEYRLGRKKKRRPCNPNSRRCKKPRFGRIIGQILG